MNNSSSGQQASADPKQIRMNRVLYGVFTTAGLIFAILTDWNNAVIFFGLAPVFDPFSPLTFQERPRWQKIWLYAHVSITMVVVGLSISKIWH